MNSTMNELERLNLQKMINENDVKDQTDKIRETKHSSEIKIQVEKLLEIKKKYSRLSKSNSEQFDQICISQCSFLFNNYTDIFNKIKKDELDINILQKFLVVLKRIEDGNIDQHEGSFMVGKLLKELYVDSALKKSENLDKKNNTQKKLEKKLSKPREISWREYKEKKLNI